MNESCRTDGAEDVASDDRGLSNAIFEQATLGVAQVEAATGRFVRFNERCASIVGYTRDELEKLDFPSLTNPDDLPELASRMRQLAAGDLREFALESRFRSKSGGVVWVNLRVWAVGQPGEPPTSCLTVVEDVTAWKGMQAELSSRDEQLEGLSQAAEQINAGLYEAAQRELADRRQIEAAHQRLTAIIENTTDLVSTATPDAKLTYLNRAGRQLAGWGEGESLAGRVIGDLHPAWALRLIESEGLRTAAATGHWEGETAILHRDGRQIPVSQVILAHRSPEGRLQYFSTIVRDITERKQVEEALRDGEERFRALFETMAQGVVYQDSAGRIFEANPAAQRILGLTLDQMQGRTSFDPRWRAIHEDGSDFPGEDHPAVTALRTGQPVRNVVMGVFNPAANQHSWINVSAVPQFRAGEAVPCRVYTSFEDITDRKQAEAALRDSRALYESLVENLQQCVFRKDWEGRFTFANQRFCELVRHPLPELIGRTDFDLFPSELAGKCRSDDLRVMESGQTLDAVESHKTPAGEDRFVHVVKTALRGAEGQVVGLQGIFWDITERVRAEAALRREEDRLRAIIEGAPFGAHSYELQPGNRLVLTGANRAADRILGIDHAALIGRAIEEVFPGLVGTEIPERYRDLAAAEGTFEQDQVLCEGAEIRGAFAINAFHTGPQRMTVFFRDVTERSKAEAALRQAEAKYHALFDNAIEGIFQTTPEGTILAANPAMARMLGYESPEELIRERNDIARQCYADPKKREEFRSQIEKHGTVTGFEYECRRRDGCNIWVSENARAARDESGRVTHYEGTMEDITGRKRAEKERQRLQEQLTQAQKMESVGRLAGGVAHDFNNMLQAILGNVALALEDIPPESPLRESLEEIQKAAKRSADLTQQLLAFARKQTIVPRVLDLNDTVPGMLKMLRRLIGEDIHLAWMPGANLWQVKMDPSQIDQILANLCVNARDAITGTGKVTIETSNVTLDESHAAAHPDSVPGDYVMLVVSDTGHGMDAATRAHLFEPFFTTKELGKGTGLGLATVFGIVKQNLGMIDVWSEPGRGTTFRIYLPRAVAETTAPEPGSVEQSARGTETALLVEDEEQILNLGQRILKQHGYTVLAASTPEAGLALAAQHNGPIHLLITDVVMPGMNGRELRDRLRASHPNLKCLFMSGYTADVIAHHGVLEEGVDFLQKPFTIRGLTSKVRGVLEAHPKRHRRADGGHS